MFSEKLDLLMKLTGTTNSALARNVALDPSYISRLRRGERTPSRHAHYARAMASYLASSVSEEYQREVLSGILRRPPSALASPDRLSEYLYGWLLEDDGDTIEIRPSERSLSRSVPIGPKDSPPPVKCQLNGEHIDPVTVECGVTGKRRAILAFLERVVSSDESSSLLLYSDESLDWLTEDPSFARRWASLLKEAIGRGNKVKIVHTVSRNFDEMLEALERWMPLYMTGSIEPYYYPKKRDGIFGRTLFVAPKTVALTSTSIAAAGDGPTFLTSDAKAVDALRREISGYISLCRPLMEVFTPRDVWQYLHTLAEFEGRPGNAFFAAPHPSILSMPLHLARSMIERSEFTDKSALIDALAERQTHFVESLKTHRFSEILSLPARSEILDGEVRAGLAGLDDDSAFRYERDEYALHLENVNRLARRFENYDVAIKRGSRLVDYTLYVREDVGAAIVRTRPPNVAFKIDESNLTAALWDYLRARHLSARREPEDVLGFLREIGASGDDFGRADRADSEATEGFPDTLFE